MHISARSETRLQQDSADTREDAVAVARWENEGGATSDPTRHASFFAVMFNWFRTPTRAHTHATTHATPVEREHASRVDA
jgi:hypothetical protein